MSARFRWSAWNVATVGGVLAACGSPPPAAPVAHVQGTVPAPTGAPACGTLLAAVDRDLDEGFLRRAERRLADLGACPGAGDRRARATAELGRTAHEKNPDARFTEASTALGEGNLREARALFDRGVAESGEPGTWRPAYRVSSGTWEGRELGSGEDRISPGPGGRWEMRHLDHWEPSRAVRVEARWQRISAARLNTPGELWSAPLPSGSFTTATAGETVVAIPASARCKECRELELPRFRLADGAALPALRLDLDKVSSVTGGPGWVAVLGERRGGPGVSSVLELHRADGEKPTGVRVAAFTQAHGCNLRFANAGVPPTRINTSELAIPCLDESRNGDWPRAVNVHTGKLRDLGAAEPGWQASRITVSGLVPAGDETPPLLFWSHVGEGCTEPGLFLVAPGSPGSKAVALPGSACTTYPATSPDGAFISAETRRLGVRIWNAGTRELAFATSGGPRGVSVLPDGTLCLAAHGSRQGFRWSRDGLAPSLDGACRAALAQVPPALKLPDGESALSVSPGGRFVATSSRDARLRIRSIATLAAPPLVTFPTFGAPLVRFTDERWAVARVRAGGPSQGHQEAPTWLRVDLGKPDKPIVLEGGDFVDLHDVSGDGSRVLTSRGICSVDGGGCRPLQDPGPRPLDVLPLGGPCSEDLDARGPASCKALTFVNGERHVVGVLAGGPGAGGSRIVVWSSSTGRILAALHPAPSGGWIFTRDGGLPPSQSPVSVVHPDARAGLVCTVGKRWFPWSVCGSHFEDDMPWEASLRELQGGVQRR